MRKIEIQKRNKRIISILNKDFLRKEYLEKKKSSIKIGKEINIDSKTICCYLRKFGIIRTRKESLKLIKRFPLSEEHKKKISKKMLGKNHPSWNGGKRKTKAGYIQVYHPNHPNRINNVVFEHRLVIEKYLGRYLTSNEVVHHINDIKNDNRLENLMLLKCKADHQILHSNQRRDYSLIKKILELKEKGLTVIKISKILEISRNKIYYTIKIAPSLIEKNLMNNTHLKII